MKRDLGHGKRMASGSGIYTMFNLDEIFGEGVKTLS